MNRKISKRLNSTPSRNKLSNLFTKKYYKKLVTKYIDENATTNEQATPNCNCNWCTIQNEVKSAKSIYST